MFCVLYWDFKCLLSCHTSKTKVPVARSRAKIPPRTSHRIYSDPCRGWVQTCNKVYESAVRHCERIVSWKEKRWESGKPESSEWRWISLHLLSNSCYTGSERISGCQLQSKQATTFLECWEPDYLSTIQNKWNETSLLWMLPWMFNNI